MSMQASSARLSVGLLVIVALLQACVDPDARLRQLAAPYVSCTEDELSFVEGRGNAQSAVYVVECDGGPRYRCISRGRPFGDEPDTVCSPEATAKLDVPEYEP